MLEAEELGRQHLLPPLDCQRGRDVLAALRRLDYLRPSSLEELLHYPRRGLGGSDGCDLLVGHVSAEVRRGRVGDVMEPCLQLLEPYSVLDVSMINPETAAPLW